MTLLICRTCPRYDPRATGEFGRRLTAALAQITDNEPDSPVAVRNVPGRLPRRRRRRRRRPR